MSTPRSTAAHASVAYLRVQGFAQQAVAEQARLKARLDEALAAALSSLPADERIVLDAPEGAAVVVLANPRGALHLAWRFGDERELAIAVGLAHGAVRVAQGTPAALYGDALVAAEAVSKSTPPGGASASREFRDALARSAPGVARQLAHGGSALDAQDRTVEMFRADRESCAKRRRLFFAVTGGVAAAIVMLGLVIRVIAPPQAATAPIAATSPASPGARSAPVARPAPAAPIVPARPATVTFEIRPSGEIYVDGELKGKSPPLKKIQIPAGKHHIEIRSGRYKPLATDLMVAEGEELTVQHSFAPAQQPQKGFWKGLVDKVK